MVRNVVAYLLFHSLLFMSIRGIVKVKIRRFVMAKDTDLQALSRVFKVMENLEISGN